MTDEEPKDKRIVYIAAIVVALVGLLIVIIRERSIFPPIMFQSIVVVLLLLIVVVNGYGVFGQPFIRLSKKMIMAGRHHFLVKKYFKEFDRFVDRLEELFEPCRCDNIPYVLNKLQNEHQEFRDILPSTYDFSDLFAVFRAEVGKSHRNKVNFLLLIRWFESILNVYNKQLICNPVERIRKIPKKEKPRISEEIKEEYKENKATYVRFILRYMEFAKDMNKKFGEKVARDHFQRPKGL